MHKRYRNHEDSEQMAGIFNRVLPQKLAKNYHKQNLMEMKQKQQMMQNRIQQ